MTNKEAIDTIKRAIAEVEWMYPMDYAAAFDKAIEALELLKGQEEVTFKAKKAGTKTYPFWDVVCSGCGYTDAIIHEDWKFCPNCGKKVKWNED